MAKRDRPPSDVDPKREDIAKRPRKRRDRAKAEPHPDLVKKRAALEAQARKRTLTPAVMFEHGENGWRLEGPHSDDDLFWLQIADAFATRSESVIVTFISQLEELCPDIWDEVHRAWKPDEKTLSSILAIIADTQPKTILQAAMAAQAVALHLVSMRLAKSALNNGGMVLAEEAALLTKTTRAFAGHVEALRGMQGKRRTARQAIKVTRETHYHQHLHDHRQGAPGPTGEIVEGTTHDPRAATAKECPTLPSPQPGGKPVRLPSRKGQGGL